MESPIRRVPRYAILMLALGFLIGGCAMTRVKPEAFGHTKTYAIVSISGAPEAYASTPMGGTVSGLVKAASSDSGYSSAADRLIKESVPILYRELKKTKTLRLAAEEKIIRSPAYASAKGSEPKVLWQRFLLADGYKYFPEQDDLAALAKTLRVDGVIVVNLTYTVGSSGVNLFGLLHLGTQRGVTRLDVTAIDRHGETVWRDSVSGKSDDSIGAIGESANFVKLHPLFLNATEHAAQDLVARLEQRI